jgi:hypothetical protein
MKYRYNSLDRIYAALLMLCLAFIIFCSSCTNRQMHDRWEARGIRRAWFDTVHTPQQIGVKIKEDSNSINTIIDTNINNAFSGRIPIIVPYYINNDTCINKKSVEYLIKWKTLPAIEKTIYSSFNIDDENLYLSITYDSNGKPIYNYKIKKVHVVPPHTPTLLERITATIKGFGIWLLLLILCAAILAYMLGKLWKNIMM